MSSFSQSSGLWVQAMTERFMSETSPLHKQQKEALEKLGTGSLMIKTKDYTAVVVMPTGYWKNWCYLLLALLSRSQG